MPLHRFYRIPKVLCRAIAFASARRNNIEKKNMPSRHDPAGVLSHDGFAILPGFLGPHETATVRKLVESIIRQPHGPACTRPNNTPLPLRWNDPLVQLVLPPERPLG